MILFVSLFQYTASQTLAGDRGYLVLQYSMTMIAYTQQVLNMEDLFGTVANCTVGI